MSTPVSEAPPTAERRVRLSPNVHGIMERLFREDVPEIQRVVARSFPDLPFETVEDIVSDRLLYMAAGGRLLYYSRGVAAQLQEFALKSALNAKTAAGWSRASHLELEDAAGAIASPAPRPSVMVELAISDARFTEMLLTLDGRELQWAAYVYGQGMKPAQVREVTGWSPDVFSKIQVRAKAKLRVLITDMETGRHCERQAPLLDRLLDGELSGVELQRIKLHTSHCGTCRATVAALREQRRVLEVVVPLLPGGAGVAGGGGLLGVLQALLGGGGGGSVVGAGAATFGGAKAAVLACGVGCVAIGGAVVVEEAAKAPPKAKAEATAPPPRTTPASAGLQPISLTRSAPSFAPAPAPVTIPAAVVRARTRTTSVKPKTVRKRKASARSASNATVRSATARQVEKNFGLASPASSTKPAATTTAKATTTTTASRGPATTSASSQQVEQSFGISSAGQSPPPAPKPAAKAVPKTPTCYPGDLGC